MYSVRQLIEGINNPSLIIRELNRLYYSKLRQENYNATGIDIFNQDWDNLIILDGCRLDQFNRVYDGEMQVKSKISMGSCTVEFLKGNFHGKKLHDTVYVTANPQLYRNSNIIDVEFHETINVWEKDGWDQDVGTVLPDVMTEYVIKASEQYPNKRILSHYMQPHYPFVNTDLTLDKGHLTKDDVQLDVWEKIVREDIDDCRINKIIQGYENNLREVLPYIDQLVEQLTGKTVVTSDHGNLLGEKTHPLPVCDWGHPCNLHVPELVKVPWVVYEDRDRKYITSGVLDSDTKEINEDTVKKRLADLGYFNK